MNITHTAEVNTSRHWGSPLPTEVWTIVGEQIYASEDLKSIKSLIQVCRTFRDLFKPILYGRRIIYVERDWESLLSEFTKESEFPSTLSYTKELEVHISSDERIGDLPVSFEGFQAFLLKVLSKTPNLQSFRWHDDFIEDGDYLDHSRCQLLQDRNILIQLKKLSKLRHLSLRLPSPDPELELRDRKLWIDVRGFQGLASLELYGIKGEGPQFIDSVSKCLAQYPNLKVLGLGLDSDIIRDTTPEILITYGKQDFLEQVCCHYESRCNGIPLVLDTLRLGYGASIFQSSEGNENYLNKLVQTRNLHTLEMFNGFISSDPDNEDEDEPMKPNFGLLEDCRSLTRVCVTRLEDDVKAWLNDKLRSSVCEVIITGHHGAEQSSIAAALSTNLNLPRLSMLVARETRGDCPNDLMSETLLEELLGYQVPMPPYVANRIENEEGSQASLNHSTSSSDASGSENLPSLDSAFGLESDPEAYDEVNNVEETILDKLEGGVSQLTSLKLCIDLRTQWEPLCSHLTNLNSLTCLWLDTCYWGCPDFPQTATSLWPGITKCKDISYRYAQEICARCPSLRFIKIHLMGWKVQIMSTDKGEERELCEMTEGEMRAIEAFSIKSSNETSGLMGQPLARSSSYLKWVVD